MKIFRNLFLSLFLVIPAVTPALAEFLPPRADSGLITVEQLLAKGRYAQALGALEPVMKRHPGDADALAYMGYAYLKLEEPEKAVRYLEQALRINPKHLGANQYMGEYYLSRGKTRRALEQLQVIRAVCFTGGCAEQVALESAINKAKSPKEDY